jgi:tetratricopeptide (TPR) repeat protein
LEKSVEFNSSVGDRWGLGISYRGLGLVAQAQGDHALAMESLHTSLQIFNEFGSRWDVARVLSEIAQSNFALGNDAEAERFWRESLRMSTETQGILTTMDTLVGYASLLAKRREFESALQLLTISLDHPATVAETKVKADALALEVKAQMTLEEVESAQVLMENNAFETIVQRILEMAE